MEKQVLIIGGSGFIALNVIERFLKESFSIIVYGRTAPQITAKNLRFIEGELKDIHNRLANLHGLFYGDVIYFANNVPVNTDVDNYDELIQENHHALDFLFSISSRVVYFSSGGRIYQSSVLPHAETDELSPSCHYGRSKVDLERYIIEEAPKRNCDYLIVRPSNPYGRHQKLYSNQGLIAVIAGKILLGKDIEVWGAGTEVRDYIYIDDFVDIFYLLLISNDNLHKVINIGSGVGVSTIEVIDTVIQAMGKPNVIKKKIDIHRSIIPSNILCNKRLKSIIGDYKFTSLNEGVTKFINELKVKG